MSIVIESRISEITTENVSEVNINGSNVTGFLNDGRSFSTYVPNYPNLVDKLNESGVKITAENLIRRIYQFLFYKSNAPRSKKTRILISEMKKLNFNNFNLKGMIVKKNDDFLTFLRKTV